MNQTMSLSVVYSAIDKITGPVKKMNSAVSSFENMTNRGRGMLEWGKNIGIGAAMMDATANRVKQIATQMSQSFFEMEKQMTKLDNSIKSSGQNQAASLAAAKKAALDWEQKYKGAAVSFIALTDRMSAAGLKDVDAIRATRQALTLATATMSDVNTAGSLLITAWQQLGDKNKDVTEQMKKHADITAKVQQIYSMDGISEFTTAMRNALPAAAAFKQKYEEAAVAVGTLQQAGWEGGKAGSAYASILGQMDKASKELGFTMVKNTNGTLDFVATIDKISSKYGDLNKVTPNIRDKLTEAFGDEGLRMLMVYQQQSGRMKQAMDDLNTSVGAAAASRDKMESTGFGKMEKYMQRLTTAKTGIIEKILGNPRIMDEVIPKFIQTVEWAVNLGVAFANANPNLTSSLIVLGSFGAGLVLLLAPIVSLIGVLMTLGGTAMSATSIFLSFYKFVASGNAILKAQAYLRLLHIKYIGLRISVMQNITTMRLFGIRVMTAGKASAIAGMQGIRSFVIGLFAMGKAAIFTAITALPGMIAGVWAFTAALLANPITWVVIGIMALIGAIVLCIKHWDALSAAAGAAWIWIKSTAADGMDFLMSLPQRYIDFLFGFYGAFFDAGKKLWTTFADGIGSVLSAPVDWLKKGIALIDDYLPHSDARKGPLSQLTRSGQSLMTTFAAGIPKGYDALKKNVSNALDDMTLPAIEPQPFSFDSVRADILKGYDFLKKTVSDELDNIFTFPSPQPQPFPIGGSSDIPGKDENPEGTEAVFGGNKSGNHYHFHGPITLKVEKMNNPEQFMDTLKIFAAESGG